MASVALAFGSFGDIVALIQILVDLSGTLRSGKASTEYHELIAELGSLQSVLESIKREILTPPLGTPIFDRSSLNAIGLAVERCRSLVKDFTDNTRGYGKYFMVGEPGNNLWDFWWNVNWRLLKKGTIVELREQLSHQRSAMILILSVSSSASLRRIEQQLKQISITRTVHEQGHAVPLGAPPQASPLDFKGKMEFPGGIPEIAPPFQALSPLFPESPLYPSSAQIDYSGSDFDDHIHTSPPHDSISRDTLTQHGLKYQASLLPESQRESRVLEPGWRRVSKSKKQPPRINTNVSPPLAGLHQSERVSSPGLYQPYLLDTANGRASNVGKPGGYWASPLPLTPQATPSVNSFNMDGAYENKDGLSYLSTGHERGGWGYPSPYMSRPNHSRGENTTMSSWDYWYPRPELIPSTPSSLLSDYF